MKLIHIEIMCNGHGLDSIGAFLITMHILKLKFICNLPSDISRTHISSNWLSDVPFWHGEDDVCVFEFLVISGIYN